MMNISFSRPTIIAAVELLSNMSQADFNNLLVRLSLNQEISLDTNISTRKKCALVGNQVDLNGDKLIQTVDGEITLSVAIVREAIEIFNSSSDNNKKERFKRGLARDGYIISIPNEYNTPPILRSILPEEINLTETDDEVHKLLNKYSFSVTLGHLEQAIQAHTRGEWAAANSQIRSFLESLFNEIARHLFPQDAAQLSSSENLRTLLYKKRFFIKDGNEWTDDGKNYINGLFKVLHPQGSHPGLSEEDHSTFRLHVALVTARLFLRRLQCKN